MNDKKSEVELGLIVNLFPQTNPLVCFSRHLVVGVFMTLDFGR